MQSWDDSIWVNGSKGYIYTYDANNNMIENLWNYWDRNSNWVIDGRINTPMMRIII